MITSTLFTFVVAVTSLAGVNGGIVQRDGFTYLSPQPTSQASKSGAVSPPPTTTTAGSTPPVSVPPVSPPVSSPPASVPPVSPPASSPPASVPPPTTSSPPVSPPASSPPASVPAPPTSTTPTTPPTTTTPSSQKPSSSPAVPPVTTSVTPTPSTSPTPPSGTANCNGVQQWLADFAYVAGNKVIFNNQLYTALQWTYDNAPPAHPDQWTANGVCSQPINNKANCNGVAAWQNTVAYTAGSDVTYNNHLWQAVQWTEASVPGGTSGTWQDLGVCA